MQRGTDGTELKKTEKQSERFGSKMFGSKIKIWMENYIVRPRKKEVQKEKPKGMRGEVILESSESLTHSDTGISSSSQQVLSTSTTDNKEGYSTTTMESERSEATHSRTAISLPSPESAYSTGYSTDGTSPGATGPPEYYINIRTGKHYFPSPAPTPTSPQPNTAFLQFHTTTAPVLPENAYLPYTLAASSSSFSSSNAKPNFQTSSRLPSHDSSAPPRRNVLSTSVPNQSDIVGFSKYPCKKSTAKSQLASLKLFLKSPKQDKRKSKFDNHAAAGFDNKKKPISNGKPKKWFKQPFQKFGHRRMDSCYERQTSEIHFEKNFGYLLGQENSTSPRQRNRIKTNPWLPTEPMSSQNFQNIQISFSPSLVRNRSCSNTPLQNRKLTQVELLQNRIKHLNLKLEEPNKDFANSLEKAVNRYLNEELAAVAGSSGHSDEDLTLNEMMGTYNESYIYEKETDILSDSDPTDCEDCITDSEAENGGDEQDSHDEELDFIDNGSATTESDDNVLRNTGKCSYFDVRTRKNYSFHKGDRCSFRNASESRKNSKKSQDSKTRREKRKQTRKSFRREDEEKPNSSEGKAKPKVKIDENVGGLNLNRVLLERMKNVSKSVEGTPATARRRKVAQRELGENQTAKRDNGKPLLVLGDAEADKKYKELIKEAENIFEALRNSPMIKKRVKASFSDNKDPTNHKADPERPKPGTACSPLKKTEMPRKSPKELGLKLSVETPKKLQRLNSQANKESSFKARTSAHSPLDPLGPNLRNFAVFKPSVPSDERKPSTSSSEDSKSRSAFETKVPQSPLVPNVPIAFQSVDLGKPLTSYCPQSEPVKRKIYSCSKTYDKLVKQFETKPTIFEETINAGDVGRVPFKA